MMLVQMREHTNGMKLRQMISTMFFFVIRQQLCGYNLFNAEWPRTNGNKFILHEVDATGFSVESDNLIKVKSPRIPLLNRAVSLTRPARSGRTQYARFIHNDIGLKIHYSIQRSIDENSNLFVGKLINMNFYICTVRINPNYHFYFIYTRTILTDGLGQPLYRNWARIKMIILK